MKLSLVIVLLACTAARINCENLPVFIWGQKTPSFLPALNQLNGDEFVTLVKSQSDKDTLTVVFVERSLSTEDLSQCKLKTETCFENLRKISQKTYLTAVEDPVEALETSFGKQISKTVWLDNDGKLTDKIDGDEKILFVYLDGSSNEDFAKHDELMSKLYNSIASKRANVIAIYTARHPSFVYSKPLIRKTRNAEEAAAAAPEAKHEEAAEAPKETKSETAAEAKKTEAAKEVKAEPKQPEAQRAPQQKQDGGAEPETRVIVNDHLLFALNRLTINEQEVNINNIAITVNETANRLTATLTAGENTITFHFILSAGTWWANQVLFGGKRFFTTNPISAYDGKSFACGDLELVHAKEVISIGRAQIQPLFNAEGQPALTRFSDDPNDCVGFFSAAIWGGLFVVILLLSILAYGLMMIMDIRTMDRFDDPKGKTITINAQE